MKRVFTFSYSQQLRYSKKQQRVPEAIVSSYSFKMSILSFISACEFKNKKMILLTLKILRSGISKSA
jgi:hypothetical protein